MKATTSSLTMMQMLLLWEGDARNEYRTESSPSDVFALGFVDFIIPTFVLAVETVVVVMNLIWCSFSRCDSKRFVGCRCVQMIRGPEI